MRRNPPDMKPSTRSGHPAPRRVPRNRWGAVALVPILVMMLTTPARAELWSGSCALQLTFNFSSPVRATGSAPNYTIGVSPAADLADDWSGSQPCAISLDPTDPIRRTVVTSATGETDSLLTCGAWHSFGNWDQNWYNRTGGASPAGIDGFHLIAGTWNEWVMKIENPTGSFISVVELTVHPNDAGKLAQCNAGGITSLRMIAVQAFQDP